MNIYIDDIELDNSNLFIKESFIDKNGIRLRKISISGFIEYQNPQQNNQSLIDQILSRFAYNPNPTKLVLRQGRQLHVQCQSFAHHLLPESPLTVFELQLLATSDTEESETLCEVSWSIQDSSRTCSLTTLGTAPATPIILIYFASERLCPSITDGTRTLVYPATVPENAIWSIDTESERVTLNNHDISPYLQGSFPIITPPQTQLLYSDDSGNGHVGNATIRYRHRWW